MGTLWLPKAPPPPQCNDEAQKVIPSLCSPEDLGSDMTWQEVVSLLEDQASPFQAKEATLLSFIEAQEEVMAEDSLAWGWCRMVLRALEQGEDVTGKAIQQAKEVIASELPKSEEPLTPEQVLGQQEREEDLAHGEGTDSEEPSHEKVKPSASPDQYRSIMSANVTSFNNGALEWVTSSKAKVVCLQETHLTPELLHGRRATLQSLGWDLYAEPASLSDKGTRLGGTACALPCLGSETDQTVCSPIRLGGGRGEVGWRWILFSLVATQVWVLDRGFTCGLLSVLQSCQFTFSLHANMLF